MNLEELKLIYVHKVGNNAKGEGIYEFIFSSDASQLNTEELGWEAMPAKGNAQPPHKEDYDLSIELKTDYFNIICLSELTDRKYIDGYYNIHAIAFEDLGFENDHNVEYDDVIVFQYRESFKSVEDKFYKREIIHNAKTGEFIHANKVKFKKEIAE